MKTQNLDTLHERLVNEYSVQPISERASTPEIRRAMVEVFKKFQGATFHLVRCQMSRDNLKRRLDSARAGSVLDVFREQQGIEKSLRKTVDERAADVDTRIEILNRQFVEAELTLKAWTNILAMLRFLGQELSSLAMLDASDRKFSREAPPADTGMGPEPIRVTSPDEVYR